MAKLARCVSSGSRLLVVVVFLHGGIIIVFFHLDFFCFFVLLLFFPSPFCAMGFGGLGGFVAILDGLAGQCSWRSVENRFLQGGLFHRFDSAGRGRFEGTAEFWNDI
jgi:hypothetical protein